MAHFKAFSLFFDGFSSVKTPQTRYSCLNQYEDLFSRETVPVRDRNVICVCHRCLLRFFLLIVARPYPSSGANDGMIKSDSDC